MIKGQKNPPLSGTELRFPRENYAEHNAAWIGRKLGRTAQSVLRQAGRLGLSKKRGRPLKSSVYVKFKRNKENRKEDNQ